MRILCFFCIFYNTLYAQSVQLVSSANIVATPSFKECHAASIVEIGPDELLATWFAGSRESNPDVVVWVARYRSGNWEPPVTVADGVVNDTLRYPCWNPVLFKNKTGHLLLFYKVGKNPRSWWGMVKTSKDGGRQWSKAKRLPKGYLGPIKNKPIQLADGTLLHPSSTESEDEKTWHVHLEKSNQRGRHWKKIPIANDTFSVIQPTLLRYSGRRLQLLARSRHNKIVQSWSDDNGQTWAPLSKLELANPNSGFDAVTLRNGWQFLVHNPMEKGQNWWEGRHQLIASMSKDGLHWQPVYVFENAPTGEFSYPAVIETSDGQVQVVYTLNRKNIKHVVLKVTVD